MSQPPMAVTQHEALVVDVFDHQADLVAVPGQHDSRRPLRIDGGDDVAVPVGIDLGGDRCGKPPNDILDRPFVARGTWGIEQRLQKLN